MTDTTRPPQSEAAQEAPPSGLTPPSGAATAEYSAEAISRLASIRARHERDEAFPIRKLLSSVAYDECHADRAWLLARLDAHRESTAIAAPEGSA